MVVLLPTLRQTRKGEHMKTTIELAREAGLDITCDPTETPWRTFVEGWEDQFKAFEALVRADEREACAKVCEDDAWRCKKIAVETQNKKANAAALEAYLCAEAIRARSKDEK
jgi:hypothetical protein